MVAKAAQAVQLASSQQLEEWVDRFKWYRHPPNRDTILAWLGQFKAGDIGVARRILDSVRVVSELEIQQGYRNSLASLPGWSPSKAARSGDWYFVGVGGAGESGPAMVRIFREATGMTSNAHQELFVTMRELPSLRLTAADSVVFIDDFAGSGNQIAGYWPTMQELIASEAKCYLLLTAFTARAREKIAEETELTMVSQIELSASDDIFDQATGLFTEAEQSCIVRYGRRAWSSWPRGYENCGLTFVLSHKTPNNTIPILHSNHEKWVGPFPRTLLAA